MRRWQNDVVIIQLFTLFLTPSLLRISPPIFSFSLFLSFHAPSESNYTFLFHTVMKKREREKEKRKRGRRKKRNKAEKSGGKIFFRGRRRRRRNSSIGKNSL
jgi:hypothetical protein